MKILITAGGTSEKIDQVRSITNHSSGKLGTEIASALLNYADVEIDYVTTPAALSPKPNPHIQLHLVETTRDLAETLKELLQKNQYLAVIHSMAVSDFTPEVSVSQEDFINALNEHLEKSADSFTSHDFSQLLEKMTVKQNQPKKISSQTNHLMLVLKKNPKVIQQIKQLQPDTLLVAFKLLVGASKDELVTAAQISLEKNQADYVLANDLETIAEDQHIGYLVAADGHIQHADTKQAIARLIAHELMKAGGYR